MLEVLSLGIIITLAFLVGIAADRINIPRVASYVVIGVVFSPAVFGKQLHIQVGEWSDTLMAICLGIIAYLVGGELDIRKVRELGRPITYGTLAQSIGSSLFVAAGLYFYFRFLEMEGALTLALLLGVIATTTAPAATVAVMEQYKTKGPMTTTLLGIVVLDDALGIILFTIVAGLLSQGDLLQNLGPTLAEIAGSLVLGGFLGTVLGYVSKLLNSEELRFPILLGLLFICVSASELLPLSSLLSAMAMGFVGNLFVEPESDALTLPVRHIEEFVFILFFTMAGAHFKPAVFVDSFVIISIYVILRSAGKYLGAWVGTAQGNLKPEVSRWIGLGLLPQAGVAIGLALELGQREEFADFRFLILNIVLGATIIYELIGPILARLAFVKAGEINSSRG